MRAFVWDQRFVTGIELVDEQHKHLVDLVNETGDLLLQGGRSEDHARRIFADLADYAHVHFADEETLMRSHGLDRRHVEAHTRHHHDFVEQLTSLWRRLDQTSDPAGTLHGFLASWLTVHILGEDQIMARMMRDIEQGLSPAQAFEQEYARVDNSISALLDALHNLYHLLSRQNQELDMVNQELEGKVAARTHDLAEANQHLKTEQDELRRLLASMEAAQRQLLASEKMGAMGRMVAGLAHEMNTPLGIGIGALSNNDAVFTAIDRLLEQEEVSETQLRDYLDRLRQGSRLAESNLHRAATLVQRIRNASIDQPDNSATTFRLGDAIQEALLGWRERLRQAGIIVVVECPENPLLSGEPLLLEQILANLVQNSLEHAFSGRRTGQIQISAALTPQGECNISFADDGAGMPAEVAACAFEPFFTTRRGGGASGLGLYFCYNIVTERLGGHIHCTSLPAAGTRIEITFPAQAGKLQGQGAMP